MTPILVALLTALGAASAAGVTWLVARRQSSGRVDTTEAATLWAEGKAMREELRVETGALRNEVLAIRAETLTLREEAIALRAEMAVMRAEAVELRGEAAACGAELKKLRTRLATIEGRKR